MMLTSCVVELGLTGLTSTSRSSRTTCAKSLALLRSSDSVLIVHPHILIILQILYLGDGVVFFLEAIDDLLKGVF